MKIELKNIRLSPCFKVYKFKYNADLFVDGIMCAYIKNDGDGKHSYFQAYTFKRDLLKKVEDYCISNKTALSKVVDDIADVYIINKKGTR